MRRAIVHARLLPGATTVKKKDESNIFFVYTPQFTSMEFNSSQIYHVHSSILNNATYFNGCSENERQINAFEKSNIFKE